MNPKSQAAGDPVVEFREVALNPGEARFGLVLGAGEMVLIESDEATPAGGVGDVVLGMVEPVHGEVWFRGSGWRSMDLTEAERCRRMAGRVWGPGEGAAWLQNLDVDENIQLAQRFDPGQSSRAVAERARRVAESFGLRGLPKMRPVAAKRRTLQLAQWIRALLPKDLCLLMLDQPLLGATEEDCGRFLRKVAAARSEGVAVIWIEQGDAQALGLALEPTWHFRNLPAALRPRV
jgi:ABC-type uncharacterized transport system ATPase subunit